MAPARPQIDPKQRLRILIESNTPLVVVETVEEARVIQMVRAVASELQLPVFEWSIADGLARSGDSVPNTLAGNTTPGKGRGASSSVIATINASLQEANLPPLPVMTGKDQYDPKNAPPEGAAPAVYNTKEAAQVLAHLETLTIEAIFILKDLHRHLDSPVVVRLLREVAHAFSHDRRTLVLTGPTVPLPPDLQSQVEYLDFGLPDRPRLRQIVEEEFERLGKSRKLQRKISEAELASTAANLCGLTEEEAERAISQAIVARYGLLPETATDVLEAKRDILKRTGVLEFVVPDQSLKSIGGLENLKTWLRKRRAAFDEGARAAGLVPPKGVIIMGVQGCGKSMCAKAIAGEWNLPLVKFDVSAVFDKYIGETEKHVQKVFRVAEQLAPCVLWIDEMEKIFAGSGPESASSDAGTATRMLGAFLTWMQDRKGAVFVAATSNNIAVLPPELIRKGRFDEIFFVDLPTTVERNSIFNVQLLRRTMDPARFDLQRLAAASAGYSGAEIDAAIQSAMYSCYADKTVVTAESIIKELAGTVPLSATRAEDIAELRQWARQRAVPASAQEPASARA